MRCVNVDMNDKNVKTLPHFGAALTIISRTRPTGKQIEEPIGVKLKNRNDDFKVTIMDVTNKKWRYGADDLEV